MTAPGSAVVAVESLDAEVDEGVSMLDVDEVCVLEAVLDAVREVVLFADVTSKSIVATIEPAMAVTTWSGSLQSHPEYP